MTMAGETDIRQIQGMSEMLAQFRNIPKEFRGNNAKNPINKALMAAGLPIQKIAKSLAQRFDDPDTPGSIAKNIIRSRVKKPVEMFEVGIMVRTGKKHKVNGRLTSAGNPKNSPHWHYLEFGTVKQPAQPFIRPAGEAGRLAADALFAKRLKKAMDDIVKKQRKFRPSSLL